MATVRPALPIDCANPKLRGRNYGPVKYQILNSNGTDVLVGRLKVETHAGNGHAFILRRFDTQAISLTTMFRAAFPSATPNQEAAELHWARDNFDLSGNNGSKTDTSVPRLAGIWISPTDAATFAKDYLIVDIVQLVIDAAPDSKVNYRRSKKNESTSPNKAPQPSNGVTIPNSLPPLPKASSSPLPTPTPAKRRKEASPVPVPTPNPPTKTPRRSARATKSPTPTRALPPRSTRKSPTRQSKPNSTIREEVVTPGGSDETAVDDDNEAVIDTAAGEELHRQDVAEQKEMISRMKAERAGDAAMSNGPEKRAREDDESMPLKLDIKEPETEKRAIVSNSRTRGLNLNLETKQKSFAWGVAAFAFGLGAMTYLPDLF